MGSRAWFASLLLVACGSEAVPVHVATTDAGQRIAGGVTLLLPTRVCLDTMVERVRHPRPGPRGLVRTRAITSALALGNAAASAAATTQACEETVDLDAPAVTLGRVRATPELLARIRAERANRTVVTEIATRLLCFGAKIEDDCVEDDVVLSAVVLDGEGRAIHVVSLPVQAEEQAGVAVRAVMQSFALGAHGSGSLGGTCHLRGDLLDCT